MAETLSVQCTGIAAAWCPIHGDCTCNDQCEEGCDMCSGDYCATHLYDPCGCAVDERHFDAAPSPRNHPDCPLHGTASDHPNASWTPDPLDVLRAAHFGIPEPPTGGETRS